MPEDAVPRVLFLSRDGVLDGLGESQILGYLRALRGRHRFWLVTFEKSWAGGEELRSRLAARGIRWTGIRFAGRGAKVRAALGLLSFALVATGLVVTRRIRIIHARSYLPCLVALAIRAVVPRGPRVIFDMRGFWIDERAEAESWNPRGRAYRFGKALERAMLRRADAIVTLNVGARVEAARLRGRGGEAGITVIPTCVDTERFRVMSTATSDFLSPGWGERFVFVYTGAVGFWQDPETLVDFFAAARRERPDAAFLCLLRAGAPEMRAALDRAGLTDVSRVEEHVAPDDLPRWLGIPRVGIVWYRPTFSRLGNFPTKLGEYLACGLPVVIAGATADSVELVVREGVGVVVREFSPAAYRDALAGVLELAADRETPARCRRIAERELSLSIGAARYANIYRGLVERA